MVDLETTGTFPEHNGVIQIAGVRFNPFNLTIDTDNMFSRCLLVPDNRYWSESTREWWRSKRDVLDSIYARMEEPAVVMRDFAAWGSNSETFVSKPTSFDYPFIQAYCRDFSVQNPFPFWKARDLRSVIQGLTWADGFNEKAVPFVGPEHDALFDCLHQINLLFKAVQQSQATNSIMEPDNGPLPFDLLQDRVVIVVDDTGVPLMG